MKHSLEPAVRRYPVRPSLISVAALWTGILLTGFNLTVWRENIVRVGAAGNDLRLPYAAAVIGQRLGWSRIYDLPLQKQVMEGLGFHWSPFLNPPPLALVAVPLTVLPFVVALVVWTILLVTAVVIAWWLAAPDRGVAKAAHLTLALGWFPLGFGLMIGQSVALVAAAVVASWWLLDRHRPLLAGVLLSLLALKPQLAILVPLALLASGYLRAFAACAVLLGAMAVVSVLFLGGHGLEAYRADLALGAGWELTRRFALAGQLEGTPRLVLQGLVIAGTAYLGWRARGKGPELPVVAGLAGSILITPYTGFQDLAMMLPVAWLLLRVSAPSVGLPVLLGLGYAVGEFALATGPLPLLAWEAILWISLWWLVPRAAAG